MAASSSLTIRISLSGIDETMRAFRNLPNDASKELREKTLQISQDIATKAANAARSDSRQSALLASTVKARKDRLPVVQAGGLKRVGRNRKPAYKILFGSEFGSNALKQYRPHVGSGSYWFFRSIEAQQGDIDRAWNEVVDQVLFIWGGVR